METHTHTHTYIMFSPYPLQWIPDYAIPILRIAMLHEKVEI